MRFETSRALNVWCADAVEAIDVTEGYVPPDSPKASPARRSILFLGVRAIGPLPPGRSTAAAMGFDRGGAVYFGEYMQQKKWWYQKIQAAVLGPADVADSTVSSRAVVCSWDAHAHTAQQIRFHFMTSQASVSVNVSLKELLWGASRGPAAAAGRQRQGYNMSRRIGTLLCV